MRAFVFLLALAAAAPSTWAGEVTVTVAPGSITLSATATPLSDVLDLLARKTGMKIIYDGAPPRLLVSPRVERETASQAVLAVLEGLGLAYVLITDPSASRVETLFIASGVAASAPTANRPPGPPPPGLDEPREKPRPQPDDDEEEEIVRPAPVPQEPEPPRVEPPKPQLPPGAMYPGSPFAPQGPPQPVVPFIPGVTPPSPPPSPPQ